LKKEQLHNGWQLDFSYPVKERTTKDRSRGITIIFDKGLGIRETRDLLETGAPYIDFWKLGFGTSALYSSALLMKKIELVNSYNIKIYPGGTFFEIVYTQGRLKEYLKRACELGFTTVEISDGTIQLSATERSRAIGTAREMGFCVLTEIGKKEAAAQFDPHEVAAQMAKDLQDGAFKVIIEGRESGKNVTIYNEKGNIEHGRMKQLLLLAPEQSSIIWEAPLKKQHIDLITLLGPHVNLGNIFPEDALSVEALRRGLRSDTLKMFLPYPGGGKRESRAPALRHEKILQGANSSYNLSI